MSTRALYSPRPGPDGSSPRFRPVLDSFVSYKPGGGAAGAARLCSNESPYGPLPSVLEVIAAAAAGLNRYPDHGSAELSAAIAGRLGVPDAHVAVGCGSVGLTQQLLAATAEPGTEVLYAWRSFEAYPALADLAGATSVRVPLRDQAHDLAAMAAAITSRTRLIFVCNPNNPTGTAVRRAELTRFLDQVPPDCLVVLDEAYHEYVRDPGVPDGLTLYPGRPNLALLRTFSKAYGLAALRVGYLIGHEPVVAAVRKTQLPFAVNAVAQAAAIASLAAEAELMERVGLVVSERGRVAAELRGQGWTVPETEANFVWLPLGPDTAGFAAASEQAGVIVRPYPPDGVRVSIGRPAANDTFLKLAQSWPSRY
ncbi:MAG TPA: histidinol-phosphate transaminase [Streptosporangiaceae bacterium]|jgi:histidinol-phosphate aminotransferase